MKTSLFQTCKEVIFDPMKFYQKLPAKIKYKEPSLFYLKIQAILMLIIFLLLFFIFGFFFMLLGIAGQGIALFGSLGFGFLLLIAILSFPFILLLSWGMLFVSAGILHLFVLLFGGKKGYPETFKAVSYAIAPAILSFIPIINWFVGIYVLILQIIGIHQRQKLSMGRSVAVVLLPIAIVFILFLILFLSLMTIGTAGAALT